MRVGLSLQRIGPLVSQSYQNRPRQYIGDRRIIPDRGRPEQAIVAASTRAAFVIVARLPESKATRQA